MNENIPCKSCGLYYMHRKTCVENILNTPVGRSLAIYEVEQRFQPIIKELSDLKHVLKKLQKEITILEAQLDIADDYMSWVEAGNKYEDYNNECVKVREKLKKELK